MPPTDQPPPLYTLLADTLIGWTFHRTAGFPKSHRFTVGQRIDNLTLDALLLVVQARFAPRVEKSRPLRQLNLVLEQLRVLWRVAHSSGWISNQQLLHVAHLLDEAGRMAGGWLTSLRPEAR